MVLNIAMNYGSRDEIVRAVKNISTDVKSGKGETSPVTLKEVGPVPKSRE